MDAFEWEGIAADILGETGCDEAPVDAFVLAGCSSLRVKPWRRSYAQLDRGRGVIRYPVDARLVRQHGLIAHEVGHWALTRARAPNTEAGARYLAGAFLLPRRIVDRDLKVMAWAMDELRAKHVNASVEMIARRITELRDAVATVIDNGRVTRRVASAWLATPGLRRISRWERQLADEALRTEQTVHGDELCYAVPVIDPPWRRVVLVCEAEQLSLRLR